MPNELTITNLECVVTKLRLEPGDALVVRCDRKLREVHRVEIARAFEESLGVPAIVLPDDITLQAVLNVPPELVERATQLGHERTRKMLEPLIRYANAQPDLRHLGMDSGNADIPEPVSRTEESHA